ncbi:MAG: SufBD protein [Lawsonibacter sp.]|nr:SufBD protein [Lawsonibacter sp.]
MDSTTELVANLRFPKDKIAYAALKELTARSQTSDQVYPFFDEFVAMLGDKNSLVRNRGLVLIAQNARWDADEKLDQTLDAYLDHIMDEKPITARQCIQNLIYILAAKPALASKIRAALESADFSAYPDSLSPLLEKDRIRVLKQIEKAY